MTLRLIPYLLVMLISLSGCTILGNLDEISTLNNYSKESEAQHRLVKSVNTHYEALSKAVDEKRISEYKDKEAVIRAFGEPLIKKDVKGQERWLYRYAIDKSARDKVYLYFDAKGNLVKWEKLPCSKLL